MSDTSRIESLETQVRTLKRMLLGVFGLVVVGGLLAATTLQSVPDVIQAKKFEVVNDEGMVVAGFFSTIGGGYLSVRNKDGKPVVAIFGYGGAGISLHNSNGKTVAQLSADAYGGMLSVSNKDGKTVALMSADSEGDGAVRTIDSKGQITSTTP